MPDDACDYFNPGSGTGTTNTTGGTTTTTGGNTTVTPPPTTTTGPVIPPPTPTPTGNILPTGFILPPLPTGTVSTGSTGNLFSGINLTGLVTTGTTKITGTNITTGSVFQLRETLVTVQPVATSPWDPTKSTATTKTTTLSGKPVDTSKPVYTALDVQAKALVNNINKPRTCDDTMVEAYKYAKSKDLISAKSVEDA